MVELRRSLLLSTDDLLVVIRECIQSGLNRSKLQRLLVHHEVSNIRDLIPQPEGEAKPKTFKDYLSAMADEDSRTYLFVAIDLASRWVYWNAIGRSPRRPPRVSSSTCREGPVPSAHPAHEQPSGLHGPLYPEGSAAPGEPCPRPALRRLCYRPPADAAAPSPDQRPGQALQRPDRRNPADDPLRFRCRSGLDALALQSSHPAARPPPSHPGPEAGLRSVRSRHVGHKKLPPFVATGAPEPMA